MDGNRALNLSLWVYDRLAAFFPLEFQSRFSGEPRLVFEQALHDAHLAGRPLGSLVLRELAGLPDALARCHWAALRAGGWKTALAYLALALLTLLPADEVLTGLLGRLVLLPAVPLVLLAALVLGFPRWSLPYAGFIINLVLLIGASGLIGQIGHLPGMGDPFSSSLLDRLLYSASLEGLLKMALMALVGSILLLLRFLAIRLKNRLPARWHRPRAWSDLSFLLYGAAVVSAAVTFEAYRYAEPLKILAFLYLLAGALGYMRAPTPARGLRSLLVALALTFTTIAAGKWFIYPLQNWPGWPTPGFESQERWLAVLSMLVELVWLAALIAAPAAWRWYTQNPPAPLNPPWRVHPHS